MGSESSDAARQKAYISRLRGPAAFLFRPTPDAFQSLEWLSPSMGNQCRFLGHVGRHYSVAEHSYHCWAVAPAQYKWAALLHDVHETIVGDISAPWKPFAGELATQEEAWAAAAAQRFRIDWNPETIAAVEVIDRAMLATEFRDLQHRFNGGIVEELGVSPLPMSIVDVEPRSHQSGRFTTWGALWQHTVRWMWEFLFEHGKPDQEDLELLSTGISETYRNNGLEYSLQASRVRIDALIRERLANGVQE